MARGTADAASYPPDQHWSKVKELADADLKLIWEPSRFAWVFDLARLHALDRSTAAPDVFWSLFEDWCDEQSAARRGELEVRTGSGDPLMAVTFGAMTFGDEPSPIETTATAGAVRRRDRHRIIAHWRYARSQDNNHIVSEAVGLITVALLFPDLAVAPKARKLGERLLREACEKLVFADGGTSQYSLNYHRVFMENFIWAMWLYRSLISRCRRARAALDRTHDSYWRSPRRATVQPATGATTTAHIFSRWPSPGTSTCGRRCAWQLSYSTGDVRLGWSSRGGGLVALGQPERYLPNKPEPEGVQTRSSRTPESR